jgi:HTH-type transcriptional regulator/antitoxin HipB
MAFYFMEQFVSTPKALGAALRRQRKLKKMNQTEAGIPIRLDQATISDIERGTCGTRIETIFRLLAALELDMILRSRDKTKLASDDW